MRSAINSLMARKEHLPDLVTRPSVRSTGLPSARPVLALPHASATRRSRSANRGRTRPAPPTGPRRPRWRAPRSRPRSRPASRTPGQSRGAAGRFAPGSPRGPRAQSGTPPAAATVPARRMATAPQGRGEARRTPTRSPGPGRRSPGGRCPAAARPGPGRTGTAATRPGPGPVPRHGRWRTRSDKSTSAVAARPSGN